MINLEREHRHERGRENMNEREHKHGHEQFTKHRKVCTVDTGENITITTPVVVNAYADSCNVEIECQGHEIIKDPCRRPNHSRFKIRQKIHLRIPIDFVAECNVGEGQVDFDFDEE